MARFTTDKTTDLPALRKGARFTWGEIVKIHDVGRYTLVEYIMRPLGNASLPIEAKAPSFSCYVDGVEQSVSSTTLEGALLLCMSRAHLEANEARYMAIAAAKLLAIPQD